MHIAGQIEADQIVTNDEFGISENAVSIRWDSSIYQSFRERREIAGESEFVNVAKWVDEVHETSRNEGSQKTLPGDGVSVADDVALGAFTLTDELVVQLEGEPLPLATLPPSYAVAGTLSDGTFWTGNPNDPQIGDERIDFFIVRPPVDVTVIAQQSGPALTGFTTEAGTNEERLYAGTLSKGEIISGERGSNRFIQWVVRFASLSCLLFVAVPVTLEVKPALDRFVFFRSVGKGAFFVALALFQVAMMALVIGFLRIAFQPSAFWFGLATVTAATSVFWLVRKNRKTNSERAAEREAEIAASDAGRNPRIEGYKVLHGGHSSSQPQDSLDGQDSASSDAFD